MKYILGCSVSRVAWTRELACKDLRGGLPIAHESQRQWHRPSLSWTLEVSGIFVFCLAWWIVTKRDRDWKRSRLKWRLGPEMWFCSRLETVESSSHCSCTSMANIIPSTMPLTSRARDNLSENLAHAVVCYQRSSKHARSYQRLGRIKKGQSSMTIFDTALWLLADPPASIRCSASTGRSISSIDHTRHSQSY